MAALPGDLVAALDAGETLVTPSPQRATALRAAWSAHQARRGLVVWATPDILHFDAWAERILDSRRDSGRSVPRLLSPVEQVLLWRDVAGDLVQRRDLPLLGSARLADALRQASQLLQEYRIAREPLVRESAAETQWLLAARDEVARRLNALEGRLSWMDAPDAPDDASTALPPVRLVGFTAALRPAQRHFLDRHAARGGRWTLDVPVGAPLAEPVPCVAQDPEDELRRIARACRATLERDPEARMLVVIADLDTRRSAVERALMEELDAPMVWAARAASLRFSIEGGAPLADAPPVARLLELLGVLLRPLERDDWLRWLRSWGLGAGNDALRTRLERAALAWQGEPLRWSALLRLAGAGSMADDAQPAWFSRVCAAAQSLEDARLPCHEWARRFAQVQQAFDADDVPSVDSAAYQTRLRWNQLLEDYANAQGLVGRVDAGQAYSQLRALAQRTRFAPAAAGAAVIVTPSLQDPVVAYDAIWVAGLHAAAFPAPTQVDAYVPWALQIERGVEAADPAACLALAQRQLEAWRLRTRNLTLSFARESQGAEQSVSALVAAWFPGSGVTASPWPARTTVQRLLASATAALESYGDARGLPWPTGRPLRGGAGSLVRSNECAFLGHAELRLDARPGDPPTRGLPPSERGRLLHAVLERLWLHWADRAGLHARGPDGQRADIDAAVEQVYGAALSETRDPLLRRALQRERQRATALLRALAEGEARRPPFSVVERERAVQLAIEGMQLDLRIDRIDRLESGELALFDYKTGRSTSNDWTGERPNTLQLLTYLEAVERAGLGVVAAMCATRLTEDAVSYQGVAATPESLAPLLPRPRRPLDWNAQRDVWRAQVESRVRRVAAGDAELDPRPGACRSCALPLLCRRAELLADEDSAAGGEEGTTP